MNDCIELYIHIPFCVRKCSYCDFLSIGNAEEMYADYKEALLREIRSSTALLEGRRISTVFFGGGTPTVWPAAFLTEVLSAVRSAAEVAEDAEISIEANPGTISEEKCSMLLEGGFNRISIGCQSMDNEQLRILGRIHTREMAEEAFRAARAAGFRNINMDLISAVPGQSLSSWRDTLERTADLEPEHISAYSLILEEGTPLYEQQEQFIFPSEDEEREMYEMTHDILAGRGYRQYEISNYAKPGRECRHNIGYWTGTEYLGLGIGAASLLGNRRLHSGTVAEQEDVPAGCGMQAETCSPLQDSLPGASGKTDGAGTVQASAASLVRQYIAAADPSSLRITEEVLSREDRMSEFMILGLRMTDGISREQFRERFAVLPEEVYGQALEKYTRLRLLEYAEDGSRLRLTREGISLSNQVLQEFM